MVTLDSPTVYEQAIYGEPLGRAVPDPLLDTSDRLWRIGDWPILVPVPEVRFAPEVQRAVVELRAWTGWSARRLADVLGTSHTTVLGIETGRQLVDGHSGDLDRRILDTYDVVHRVFLLAGQDSAASDRVLRSAGRDGRAAADDLRDQQPARAYLRAVDALRPRATGLLAGSRPRRDGATAALHE